MKKLGLVFASTLALVSAAVVPSALGAGARVAATGPTVTVSIKTMTKTLLRPTAEHGEKGWITKGGAPKGKCSGNSAAGALDAATHGRWTATYYSKFSDVFIKSILGAKPPSKNDFWEILVNGKVASTGACEIKLRAGERLLFKIVK
jgi:hypothetical protein